MTPAARVQAAIGILDAVRSGTAAEQALTGWARGARYAGSGDRAAVRDHVFDVLRTWRTCAATGGGEDGRALMLGALRQAGLDPDDFFGAPGYTPAPLSPDERAAGRPPAPGAEALDLPDWLWPLFQSSLGESAAPAAMALRQRAPVHLRVNAIKSDRAAALTLLKDDGIVCIEHQAAPLALEVVSGARRIRQSAAYLGGAVELQDAASQAAMALLPLRDGMRVLDFCAGGGGKTLAMAAQAQVSLFAHDAAPARMKDLPARAARAGVDVTLLGTDEIAGAGPFDLVLCDVPCSGSGTWRRAPEGKWRLNAGMLDDLCRTQASILREAAKLVAPGGVLAYATCSILDIENAAQIDGFMAENDSWTASPSHVWLPQNGTDGFFSAHLTGPETSG